MEDGPLAALSNMENLTSIVTLYMLGVWIIAGFKRARDIDWQSYRTNDQMLRVLGFLLPVGFIVFFAVLFFAKSSEGPILRALDPPQ